MSFGRENLPISRIIEKLKKIFRKYFKSFDGKIVYGKKRLCF